MIHKIRFSFVFNRGDNNIKLMIPSQKINAFLFSKNATSFSH
jgi:hypothetical protein